MPSCVLARAHWVFMVWPLPLGVVILVKNQRQDSVVGSLEPLVFLWPAIEVQLPAQLDQLPSPRSRPGPKGVQA
jgi:hypothetical protein